MGRLLTSPASFQLFYAFLKAPDLLLDNPELDIERLMKLHKSIDVVINLLETVFHAGKPFPHIFYDRSAVRLE